MIKEPVRVNKSMRQNICNVEVFNGIPVCPQKRWLFDVEKFERSFLTKMVATEIA